MRNYGPTVSGYLDPTGRNWENPVFESGAPVLDKELILGNELAVNSGQAALQSRIPSGWLADDFLSDSSAAPFVISGVATSNLLALSDDLRAHVNGWLLRIRRTNSNVRNQLNLGAGPVGQGARRTDFVFLEVWRRLLSPAPSTDGKSAGGRIWHYGNVKTDPANDASLNYADDILDVNVGRETTKRVQIQYRLRVVQGIDVFAYPQGMTDPSVVANTVPANAAAPDGVATAFTYSNQAANGDPGLWVAGDGDTANGLGTLDGYMYAIPLCAVFRRNSTAFDRRLNHNGGVSHQPGPSDRPDGLFHDVIVTNDVLDLRQGVSPAGWNTFEILQKNFNLLLDNQLATECGSTAPFGGGVNGTTLLVADEVGITDTHGGDGIVTGTTGAGSLIAEFDWVRRTFSARPTLEVVTVAVPGTVWFNPQLTFSLDPSALPIYPYGEVNWLAYAPPQATIIDIVGGYWAGTDILHPTMPADMDISNVGGLNTTPASTLVVKVEPNLSLVDAGSTLYLDLLVSYPGKSGLSKTPTRDFGAASFVVNNPIQLPAAAPISFGSLDQLAMDAPHREATIMYKTAPITISSLYDLNLAYRMPECVAEITSLSNVNGPLTADITFDSRRRSFTLQNVNPPFANQGERILNVEYRAWRPLPQNGEQVTVYYEAKASQTVSDASLGTALTVTPKQVGPDFVVIGAGAGALTSDRAYPVGYVQTGGIRDNADQTFTGESELMVSSLDRACIGKSWYDLGTLTAPQIMSLVAKPISYTLTRLNGDSDIEGRTYFQTITAVSPSTGLPDTSMTFVAAGAPLVNQKRHKVVLPVLARLAATTSVGVKGELVLLLLVYYTQSADQAVSVESSTGGTTSVSVVRLKGRLLDKTV